MSASVAEQIRRELDDATDLAEDVRAHVRKWLVADREFNAWFFETTKGKLDDDALMALLSGYGEDQDVVHAAWRAFQDDRDAPTLAGVLDRSIAVMERLKQK